MALDQFKAAWGGELLGDFRQTRAYLEELERDVDRVSGPEGASPVA